MCLMTLELIYLWLYFRNLEDDQFKEEKLKFASFVKYLLKESPEHVLDVIIQTTELKPQDTKFIRPLLR